jgi:potassium voltage-gated channel Shal-related subfamily D protein 1/potassium voltage-gated channel Shal-related subfamily D protein 2/potassium voltage-gated channel Shal-related subfamily D protein
MLKILREISQHTLIRVVFAITFFTLIGASLVFLFEGHVNEQLKAMGDVVLWVLVTMTTVVYGDKVPMTTAFSLALEGD